MALTFLRDSEEWGLYCKLSVSRATIKQHRKMDGLHVFPRLILCCIEENKIKHHVHLYVHVSDFDLCCCYFHRYSQWCYCSYDDVDYYTPLNAVAVHMLWCWPASAFISTSHIWSRISALDVIHFAVGFSRLFHHDKGVDMILRCVLTYKCLLEQIHISACKLLLWCYYVKPHKTPSGKTKREMWQQLAVMLFKTTG